MKNSFYSQKIKNKNLQKIAVALKYKYGEDKEPTVIASGKGLIAENMVKKALEHQIPLYEDTALTQILSKVKVGHSIPEELYEVVAEIIAMVYRLEKKVA